MGWAMQERGRLVFTLLVLFGINIMNFYGNRSLPEIGRSCSCHVFVNCWHGRANL
jgi:hypothetical protein